MLYIYNELSKESLLVLFGFSRIFIYLRDLPNDKRIPIDNFILFVTTHTKILYKGNIYLIRLLLLMF